MGNTVSNNAGQGDLIKARGSATPRHPRRILFARPPLNKWRQRFHPPPPAAAHMHGGLAGLPEQHLNRAIFQPGPALGRARGKQIRGGWEMPACQPASPPSLFSARGIFGGRPAFLQIFFARLGLVSFHMQHVDREAMPLVFGALGYEKKSAPEHVLDAFC